MYAGITFIMYAYSQTNNKNATGRWISPGPPVSSIKKTDRPDISEILLKVVLNTIKQTFNALSKILTSCWCFQERYLATLVSRSQISCLPSHWYHPHIQFLVKWWMVATCSWGMNCRALN
jgi:hypothetical protein